MPITVQGASLRTTLGAGAGGDVKWKRRQVARYAGLDDGAPSRISATCTGGPSG